MAEAAQEEEEEEGGERVEELRVPELRERLAERGLSTEGRKAELVERLQEAMEEEEAAEEAMEQEGHDGPSSPAPPSAPPSPPVTEEGGEEAAEEAAGKRAAARLEVAREEALQAAERAKKAAVGEASDEEAEEAEEAEEGEEAAGGEGDGRRAPPVLVLCVTNHALDQVLLSTATAPHPCPAPHLATPPCPCYSPLPLLHPLTLLHPLARAARPCPGARGHLALRVLSGARGGKVQVRGAQGEEPAAIARGAARLPPRHAAECAEESECGAAPGQGETAGGRTAHQPRPRDLAPTPAPALALRQAGLQAVQEAHGGKVLDGAMLRDVAELRGTLGAELRAMRREDVAAWLSGASEEQREEAMSPREVSNLCDEAERRLHAAGGEQGGFVFSLSLPQRARALPASASPLPYPTPPLLLPLPPLHSDPASYPLPWDS